MNKPIIIVLFCLACGLFSCTQTDSSTTAKELTPNEIAEEIHTISRSGLRGNSETLMEYVEMIDDHNVGIVVETYRNTYNQQTIFSAIIHNVFISADTRVKALKHVKDNFLQIHQRVGIYTDDIDKLLEEHINYERNKFGRMNSIDIDNDIRAIYGRYSYTLQENTLYPANGKIDDDFNQGSMPDCWLIAVIKSLSINPKGLEMLNELISIDDKGNVTVKLKGVGREYTLSKEELEVANEFAPGDLDVRAIEIAVHRYIHEMIDHTNLLKRIKDFHNGSFINPKMYDLHDGIRNLCTPYCILFGKKFCWDETPHKETIENIKSGAYCTVVSNWDNGNMDGYIRHHAYAVIGADDNYVYLSDPYKTNETLKMEHSVFLNFFDKCYSTEL